MSVSSTFTSAVINDMSAMVMMVLAAEFWTPGTTVSPDANRQVGDDAVDGRGDVIFFENVVVAVEIGLQLRDALLRGSQLLPRLRLLRSRLRQPRFGFAHGRHRRIVLGFFLIVVLLGDQLGLKQLRGAVEIGFGAVEFGSVASRAWPARL